MRHRREIVEHPFGTIKVRMGATHFQMRTLPKVATEMALAVLGYNLTRVLNIVGVARMMAAVRSGLVTLAASDPHRVDASYRQSIREDDRLPKLDQMAQIRGLALRRGSDSSVKGPSRSHTPKTQCRRSAHIDF